MVSRLGLASRRWLDEEISSSTLLDPIKASLIPSKVLIVCSPKCLSVQLAARLAIGYICWFLVTIEVCKKYIQQTFARKFCRIL